MSYIASAGAGPANDRAIASRIETKTTPEEPPVTPEAPPMDITFACRCGTRVRAARGAAGRQCRCPTCWRPLFVPNLSVILRLNPRLKVAGTRPAAAPGGPAIVRG